MLLRKQVRLMPIRVPLTIRKYIRERADWAQQETLAHEGKTKIDRELTPWFVRAWRESGRDDSRTIVTQYDDGTLIRSTLVVPTGSDLDENKLRMLIGETEFAKLVSTVVATYFDQDKLAQAIARGKISKGVVDQCTTDREGTPYIRHTVKSGHRRFS